MDDKPAWSANARMVSLWRCRRLLFNQPPSSWTTSCFSASRPPPSGRSKNSDRRCATAKAFRQKASGASGPQRVEDGGEQLAPFPMSAPPSSANRRRKPTDDGPLLLYAIAPIAQASAAMQRASRRVPHRAVSSPHSTCRGPTRDVQDVRGPFLCHSIIFGGRVIRRHHA
jgi:hypothetical protein